MNKLFNNKFAFLTFGFLTIFFFSSAVFAQTRNEVLIVADRKADCTGVAPMKCLQVKKPQDEKWSLFYQNIENFNYVEGYTYILRLRVNTMKNPPADASNLKYRLRQILHRVRTASENSSEHSSGNMTDLTANSWKLIAVDGASVEVEKAFIKFDETKKSAGGNGGCNVFGGSFERNGKQIKISEVAATMMFCGAASEIEKKFLDSLNRVTRYEIRSGKLFLYAGDKIVLEFAAKK